MVTTSGRDLEAIIDDSPVTGFQVAIIVLCALVAMLDGFDTQAIAFVAPEITAEWRVPASSFGTVSRRTFRWTDRRDALRRCRRPHRAQACTVRS